MAIQNSQPRGGDVDTLCSAQNCRESFGFHGCGDNSLRRVRFNVSKSAAPEFSQLLAIRESGLQDICQCLNITSGKDKLRVHGSNEIAGSSDLIAYNYRTSAAHGLVYDYRERFID